MPNQGVPVIFKNKIAYGYAEKSVQAYDVSVSDYNALTEQQQLDGSIRFIQGVDAIPNGSNVWAKLGTTPLAEGLPRDCSQAVNQLKSNLTDLEYTLVDVKYGNVAMNLPANWKELVIYFRYGNSSGLQAQVIQGSLLRLHTQNTNFTYAVGSGTITAQFTVNTNDNTITMVYFAVGTTAFTATSQMTVYARN